MGRALVAGGCWIGDAPAGDAGKSLRFALVQAGAEAAITDATRPIKQREGGVVLEPFGMRAALSSGSVSPIMSKIFQESNLRALGGTLLLNPATAAAAGYRRQEYGAGEDGPGKCEGTDPHRCNRHAGRRPGGGRTAPEQDPGAGTELQA